jgi:pimeloyl-ACP methyl ester carboxylesterase
LPVHGFPYSVESFVEVAPMLAERECRVIVPHLRGHGSTRFIDSRTPSWRFDDATLDRHAVTFDNPDDVDIVIHSYRHRLGLAPGHRPYADVERKLAALPAITVPTITLDGKVDGVVPATDGKASAHRFSGPREHRVIANAGHNLPEEAPREFADAVWDVAAAA